MAEGLDSFRKCDHIINAADMYVRQRVERGGAHICSDMPDLHWTYLPLAIGKPVRDISVVDNFDVDNNTLPK
jgi:hypothetical protein